MSCVDQLRLPDSWLNIAQVKRFGHQERAVIGWRVKCSRQMMRSSRIRGKTLLFFVLCFPWRSIVICQEHPGLLAGLCWIFDFTKEIFGTCFSFGPLGGGLSIAGGGGSLQPRHKINTLFNKLGGEESGLITYAQFEEGVDTVEARKTFVSSSFFSPEEEADLCGSMAFNKIPCMSICVECHLKPGAVSKKDAGGAGNQT